MPSLFPRKRSKIPNVPSRRLAFETLEGRVLPAVTAGDFSAILASYPELGLAADIGNYNLIEVTDISSDTALLDAISQAAASPKDDLIVVRTSEASHVLNIDAEFSVNINASTRGGVVIVSLGEKPLTIDASNQSRIFHITGSTEVGLGGVNMVGGFSEDNGGAILQEGGTLVLDRCVFQENTAMSGGALFQESTARTSVYNTTFIGNRAVEMGGGAIVQYGSSMLIVNSTFTENFAGSYGGAIFSFPEVGDVLTVINCTIIGNIATSRGGGITAFDAEVDLYNTVLFGNTTGGDSTTGQFFGVDATLGADHSLIENLPAGTGVMNGIDGNLIGVDPNLSGKKTLPNGQVCFPPQKDSPVIDAGNNILIPAGIEYDQIGNPRVVQATVDIGSFEWNPPVAVIDNADSLSVQEGCWRLLSGNGSTDPLGQGLVYLWDIYGTGEFLEYSPGTAWFNSTGIDGKPGVYHTIHLKVRDVDGNESDIVSARIEVVNVVACFNYLLPKADDLLAGYAAYWVFHASDIPRDWIAKWEFDWDDGTTTVLVGGVLNRVTVPHLYAASGTYFINVTATDDDGLPYTFGIQAVVRAATASPSISASWNAMPEPGLTPDSTLPDELATSQDSVAHEENNVGQNVPITLLSPIETVDPTDPNVILQPAETVAPMVTEPPVHKLSNTQRRRPPISFGVDLHENVSSLQPETVGKQTPEYMTTTSGMTADADLSVLGPRWSQTVLDFGTVLEENNRKILMIDPKAAFVFKDSPAKSSAVDVVFAEESFGFGRLDAFGDEYEQPNEELGEFDFEEDLLAVLVG